MGPKKLSALLSLVVFTMMMLLSQEKVAAQEWFGEIFSNEEQVLNRNFKNIRNKADEHFKYAEKEYYSRYFKLEDYPELQYKNIRQYISYKRWEEYWSNHIDVKGYPVSPLVEFEEFENFKKSSTKGPPANWSNINRTAGFGGYWGMGRIREIAFHPTEANTFWLGADQGGVWKTEDNGNTYTPVGDGLPFLRVSSICVDYTNPDIIYMAGGGIGTNYWQRAIGVYKTDDGGQNWSATGFTSELADAKYVRRLAISPTNPSILLLTTKTGTYRTDDAGATWSRVDQGEAWDILFHPDGETVFIGKNGTILGSADGGVTWSTIINPSVTGTFKHMAFSPVNNNNLAAQAEGYDYTAIYSSTDKGLTWQFKSTVFDDKGGTIGFSSNDANTLYRGWTKIFKSTNLGSTWAQTTNWYWTSDYPEVHADHFRIEKNPLKENTLYFCNDGGLYIYDEENSQWFEKSEGLIISQYYSLSSSQSDPLVLLCGSQDNGGWYRRPNGAWRTTNGGDGMHTWQSPENINYGYSSYPGGKLYRTNNGWANYYSLYDNISPSPSGGDWNSRFAVDPNNTNRIVTGCFEDVYESLDQGNTWKKISSSLTGGNNLHAITIPETNSNYIYTSSGPYFYYSKNKGQNWTTIYVGHGNTIQDIAVSDYDPDLIWIVTSGYTTGSKVFKSVNGGQSWENISGSLPNISALSIEHRKGTTESLYLGMTYGIYYRSKGMTDWEFFGHGIPNTEIRDLDIQYSEQKIRCATYGRGLYEADLHTLSGTFPVADYSIENNIVCADESIAFSNNSTEASTYIWNFGDGSRSSLENPEHAYSEPGTYTVKLTAINSDFTSTYSGEKEITVKPTFPPFSLGPQDREIGSGAYSDNGGAGLIFNVHTPSMLMSLSVYSRVSKSQTFEILDSNGELINSVTSNVEPGENRIVLNTEIPVGKDYILRANNTEGLFFNYSGASYPYGTDNLISITGNTEFDRDQYLFFYNWRVQYLGCDPGQLPIISDGDNISVEQIIVYPNPVRDILNLRVYGFQPDEDITVRIINMDGITIYSKKLNKLRSYEINLSSLEKNTTNLFLEVRGQSNTAVRQILRVPE